MSPVWQNVTDDPSKGAETTSKKKALRINLWLVVRALSLNG